jgi:hypothetical protein
LKSTNQRLKRWWPWIVLSAILHLPFTPAGPWLGLLSLLVNLHAVSPDEPIEQFVGIPVELLAAPAPAPEAEIPPATGAQGDVVVVTPPKPKTKKKPEAEPVDAGLPEPVRDSGPGDEKVADADLGDAGASDAGAPDAAIAADAGDADAGGTDAGSMFASSDAGTSSDAAVERPDPFAIAGELGKFQRGNVNVRIQLFVEPLKRHPAGSVIASFLMVEPQWREFLGPGGLNPLDDFSRIVIMGPQLVDSSQVGVFLEYTGDTATIRKAIDALVQHSEGGRWETKSKKPVAHVHAAGSERVIVMYPNHGVAIVPPKLAEQMTALPKFPALGDAGSEDEVLQLLLKTPYRVRAFKRFGVDVPKTIELARLSVSGMKNGGAQVRIELEDESAQAAASHAPDLERDLAKTTMGLFSLRLNAEGSRIVGEARLSPLIVAGVLREVQTRLGPKMQQQ